MNDVTPAYATIPRWCAISGMGCTRVYEELATGNLRAIKLGTRTLIDVPHGFEWMRSLPAVRIGENFKAA